MKCVPELVPEEIARKSHFKLDQAALIAKVEDLADYDAIIIGAGQSFLGSPTPGRRSTSRSLSRV
jgi:NAD(P)H dehydrogenase (quinone)